MLRMLTTRFLCLCLALTVAAQLAVSMAVAADLPCHAPGMAMASADPSDPACPPHDPACPGTGCPSHAVALPAPCPTAPPAGTIAARAAGRDVPPLRPLRTAANPLRPPIA